MKTHVNLLPWKYRLVTAIRARAVQWSLVGLATAAVLAGAWLLKNSEHDALLATTGRLEERLRPISRLGRETGALKAKLALISQKQQVLAELESNRPALTLLGLVGASAKKCAGEIRVERLSLKPLKSSETAATGPSVAKGPMAVTLQGIGVNNLAVARFVVALRETKAFDRVELKSSAETGSADSPACSYLVECSYE